MGRHLHCGCQASTGRDWLMWALKMCSEERERRYEDLVDSGNDNGWPRRAWERMMAAHAELQRMFAASGR